MAVLELVVVLESAAVRGHRLVRLAEAALALVRIVPTGTSIQASPARAGDSMATIGTTTGTTAVLTTITIGTTAAGMWAQFAVVCGARHGLDNHERLVR